MKKKEIFGRVEDKEMTEIELSAYLKGKKLNEVRVFEIYPDFVYPLTSKGKYTGRFLKL